MKNFTKAAVILIAVIAYSSSCKKDKELVQEEETKMDTVKLPDQIVYQAINQETSSVRGWKGFPDPISHLDSPVPEDSTGKQIYLDLNKDGIADFLFEAAHHPNSTFCSPHMPPYIFTVSLKGIDNEDSILVVDKYNFTKVCDTTAIITGNGIWGKETVLRLQACYSPSVSFNEGYAVVKIGRKYGWIHIAPTAYNGIYVLEFAINLTDGNSIKVGRKE